MTPHDCAAEGILELHIPSSLDGSQEPSLFLPADLAGPRPLLVALHSWSMDRFNLVAPLLPIARRNGWHLLFPEFRGPNRTTNPRAPEACASPLAKQDIVDAIAHIQAHYAVRDDAILLHGGSGGGHMAMMMAAYRPDLWRSVAAFCGITDLAAWHGENPTYTPHIAICCGGEPGPDTATEYQRRSPLYHADEMAKANLTIYHGKYDRSVPVTHALRMYDALHRADPKGRSYLQIFDGGHDAHPEWAERQFLATLATTDTPTATAITG